MVGNIIGSERCLSSCTHTCQPSDVPAVHLPEHHLQVSVPFLWPLHSTSCFYLNHQGVSGSHTSTTCTPLHLFGRLAYCRPLSGSHPPGLIKDYSADTGVWLHYQCREVFPHSISKPNVPASPPQHDLGQSHPFHRSLYMPGRVCPSVPLISITFSSSLTSSSGFHGKPGGHCAMVQDAYAPTPTLLALPLSSSDVITKLVPVNDMIRSHLKWWLSRQNLLYGTSFPQPSPSVTLTTGTWSPAEQLLHINHLELLAILKALQSLNRKVANCHILVKSDNSIVVSYLNRQGALTLLPCTC